MALVNPNIAMSFRQPEFRPRNALAEYAQVQQIMGGQRQAEVADMQLESLRRERDALGQIQAAIVAKGGPPDLGAAADAMIRTGRPEYLTQGMAIQTALRNQRNAEAYFKRYGGGAAPAAAATPANAMVAAAAPAPQGELVAAPMPSPTGTVRNIAPAAAPGAASRAVFNQDAIAGIDSEAQKSISLILDDAAQLRAKADEFRGSVRASGFLSQAEQLENQAASMLAVQKRRASESRFDTGAPATAEQVNAARQALAVGQAPAAADAPAPAGETNLAYLQRQFGTPGGAAGSNALAPAAAPGTNAMVAPAAQPAVPPASVQLASAGTAPGGAVPTAARPAAAAARAAAAAAPDANAARLKALEAQYRLIGNNPELVNEKALVLKQIEDVQATIRAESATPPEAKFMQALGLSLTPEGFAEFEALKQRPGEFERLLSQSRLSRTDQIALIQQRLRKEASHAPGTSVTLVQEKAERGKFGELLVDQYKNISNAASLAAKTLPALDTQAKILDQGFTTGFGTEVKKAGASLLSALGVPEAEKFATDAQTFLAATQQAVLQRQLEQKGPQTEADAQRITQTGAQLGNTVNANRFIIDVAKAQLKRDIDQRNFYAEWRRGPGKGSFDGAEDAWFSGLGGKSLFDRPELKKYLAPAQGAAAAPAATSVRNQADAILQRK
jgi:hypothetical protein